MQGREDAQLGNFDVEVLARELLVLSSVFAVLAVRLRRSSWRSCRFLATANNQHGTNSRETRASEAPTSVNIPVVIAVTSSATQLSPELHRKRSKFILDIHLSPAHERPPA